MAAGRREDGSTSDFYAALAAVGASARARYNATHTPALNSSTHTSHLLPDEADRMRYRAEATARFERELTAGVAKVTRASLLDGREHTAALGGARIGIQVRASEEYETYVAVRIIGSVPDALTVTVLDLIPGCAMDSWFPEYSLPERALEAAEQAWSNLMDPKAAAKLLNDGAC